MNHHLIYTSLLVSGLSITACTTGAADEDTGEPAASQLASAVTAAPCAAGSDVALLSRANGSYVTADLGYGNTPLLAEANHTLGWEKFTVVDAGGGWVALRSNANGLYVSANLDAGGALQAGWATSIAGWEKFQFVAIGDGWYGIKSYANGLYASANLGQSASPVQAAWATTIQLWEEFQCVPYGSSGGSGGTPGTLSESQVQYDRYWNGGSVDQWIQAACAAIGVPYTEGWRNGYETLTLRESSYDPNAVNTSDGNAWGPIMPDGAPQNCSRGIAQCIPPTFAAFHAAGTSLEIYDPVANIAASMNYVMAVYGVSRDGSDLAAKVQQADPNRPPKGY